MKEHTTRMTTTQNPNNPAQQIVLTRSELRKEHRWNDNQSDFRGKSLKKQEFDEYHTQQESWPRERIQSNDAKVALHGTLCTPRDTTSAPTGDEAFVEGSENAPYSTYKAVENTGRESLKRHRVEMAGRVWIPDIWGHEELLKDWIHYNAFDASLRNNNIRSARAALVEGGRRTNSTRLRT